MLVGNRLGVRHLDGQMPTAHALPVDDVDHGFVPSIAVGTHEQPILRQHLHERALDPGDDLPHAAFIFAHEVILVGVIIYVPVWSRPPMSTCAVIISWDSCGGYCRWCGCGGRSPMSDLAVATDALGAWSAGSFALPR